MNVQSFYSYSNSDSITFESLGIIFNSISETSWTLSSWVLKNL